MGIGEGQEEMGREGEVVMGKEEEGVMGKEGEGAEPRFAAQRRHCHEGPTRSHTSTDVYWNGERRREARKTRAARI